MTPIVTLLLLVGMHLISAQTIPERKNIPPAIIYGDGSSRCPSEQQRATSRQEIKERVASALGIQPPHQCGAGEWIRVAYLDMKDRLQTCPSAWRENTTNGVRVCGRPPSSNDMCHGTFYPTGGRIFNKVCGRVIGYQVGHPDAFHSSDSINSPYVEGVSITYGIPRAHIWTYAADTSETNNHLACPCDTGSSSSPPFFVGNNYYCESGNKNSSFTNYFLYADDPLWDGEQCSTEGTCCSAGRSPPWFSVTLNNPTNDNIEIRICSNFDTSEDTPIELLEIYIL
jgi:dynein heavy chain